MTFWGLSLDERNLINRLVVQPLNAAGGQVFVFGSRARGDQRKFSDLDLLIKGPVSSQLISLIREELEESRLAIKVDLVLDAELASGYRDSVERDLTPWVIT